MGTVSATTNLSALAAQRYIQKNSDKVTRATEELASGSRVSNPSYDASSAAVGYNLNAKTQSLMQASRNVMQAVAEIQMASGALAASQEVLTRAVVLTVQANSDTIGDSERNMIDKEFGLLLKQVDLNAQNARWGNVSLFAGGAGATTASGVVAEGQTGMVAVANGFAASLNAASQGMISGIASGATVNSNGNLFDVSVQIGTQTFKATVPAPTAGGTLALTSTTDSGNSIVLNYDNAAVTAFDGTPATFQRNLETLLGVNTAAKAVLTSLGTTNGGMPNVAVTSGSGTTPGTWALTYAGAAAGGTGTFKISNGIEHYQTQIATSAAMTGIATFDNGLSLSLTGFDGTTNKPQELYSVSAGGAITQSIQYGDRSTDILSITFNSVSVSGLNLNGLSVATRASAQIAGAIIETALQTISTNIATLGGKLSQLNFVADTNSITIQNLTSAKGTFVDVDISEAMVEMQKYKGLGEISRTVFTDSLNQQAQLAQMIQRIS